MCLKIPRNILVAAYLLAAFSIFESVVIIDSGKKIEIWSRAKISSGLISIARVLDDNKVVLNVLSESENARPLKEVPVSKFAISRSVSGNQQPIGNHYQSAAVALAILMLTLVGVISTVRFSRARQHAAFRSESLKQREARVQGFLNQIADSVVIVDARGIIQDCNTFATHLFGYKEQDLIGQAFPMLLSEPEKVLDMINKEAGYSPFAAHTAARVFRVMVKREDGLTFPADVSVGRTELKHQTLFTGTIRDVSDKARMEAEISNFKLEANFESHLSPELTRLVGDESRSSLDNIVDRVNELRCSKMGSEQAYQISSILRSIQNLSSTSDDILELLAIGAEGRGSVGVEFATDDFLEQVVSSVTKKE